MFRRERVQTTRPEVARQAIEPVRAATSKHMEMMRSLANNLTPEQRMLKEKAEAAIAPHLDEIAKLKAQREAEEALAKAEAEARAMGGHKYQLRKPVDEPQPSDRLTGTTTYIGPVSGRVHINDMLDTFERQIEHQLVKALHERLAELGIRANASAYAIAKSLGIQYQTLLALTDRRQALGLKRIVEVCAALDYIPQFSLMDSRNDSRKESDQ